MIFLYFFCRIKKINKFFLKLNNKKRGEIGHLFVKLELLSYKSLIVLNSTSKLSDYLKDNLNSTWTNYSSYLKKNLSNNSN